MTLIATQPVIRYRKWVPTDRQEIEPDTTWLMDLDVEEALDPVDGGMVGAGESYFDDVELKPPWRGGDTMEVVAGKYRDGLKSLGGLNSFVFLPSSGVIPTGQWTCEFFVKSDVDWSALSNAAIFRVYNDVFQFLAFTVNVGTLVVRYRHDQDDAGFVDKAITKARAVSAGTWVNLAVTLFEGTMRLYIDGVLEGTVTGCTAPRLWNDNWLAGSGIAMSVETEDITISDVRVSSLARTPREIPG